MKCKNNVKDQHINTVDSYSQLIDIKPTRDGGWCVIAHTASGDCHDFFQTQAQALDFAQAFYGGKVKTVGQAPATTAEACLKYHTSEWACSCPDSVNRGGSWLDFAGQPACKHMIHVQEHGIVIAPAAIRPIERQTQPTAEELFARFA